MAKRIEKVQDFLKNQKLDALLIQSKTMKKWMSTMLGSGCKVLITQQHGYLILDGRYITEAKETEFDLEIKKKLFICSREHIKRRALSIIRCRG